MKLIYISGKISDKTKALENKNRDLAKKYAVKLWKKGYVAICPHINNNFQGALTWEQLIKGDLKLIEVCDIVFMLPNWKTSKGAIVEYNHAKKLNKIIKFRLKDVK